MTTEKFGLIMFVPKVMKWNDVIKAAFVYGKIDVHDGEEIQNAN